MQIHINQFCRLVQCLNTKLDKKKKEYYVGWNITFTLISHLVVFHSIVSDVA